MSQYPYPPLYKEIIKNKNFKHAYNRDLNPWCHWFYNPEFNIVYLYDRNHVDYDGDTSNFNSYIHNLKELNKETFILRDKYYNNFIIKFLKLRFKFLGINFKKIKLIDGSYKIIIKNDSDLATFLFYFNDVIK